LLHHLGSQGNDLGELTLSGDLVGSVPLDRLRAAWDKLVARHPALRATVHWSNSAAPMLKIHGTSGAAVETVDLSHLPDSEQQPILAGLVEEMKRRPIDLQQLPTTRVTLVKRSNERHTFIWRCHHLFLDGWSSTLVLQELLAQLVPSAEAAVDQANAGAAFHEYHDWVASIPPCQPGRFWSEYMRGCPPCLIIDDDREPQAKHGPQERATLVHQPQHPSLGALRSAAARFRTTPAALGIASWAIVLANLTQRHSVCFGLACSGRNAPISNPGAVVGNLSNLVPLRAHCDPGADVSNWLRDLMEQQDRVSRHAHVSTVRIANWSTTGSESPFFDTTLAIANYPWVDPSRAVRLECFEGDTTSTYPVSVSLSLNHAYALWIDYDTRLLSTDGARYLASLYTETLAKLCDEPSPRLGSLFNGSIAPEFRSFLLASRRDNRPPPGDTAIDRNETRVPRRARTTEERLLALFRETLSARDCGPDDNFFELGGTSMHAVRLFNAIEKVFHKRLPVSVLFQFPTASSLSSLLQSSAPSTQSFGSLVEIRRGDTRFPPLFLIHAGGLEVLFYKQLADSLDPQLPVYGLQPVGLDGTEPPLDDIRAIAGRYVTEIQGVHPGSPYFLLGHCFGVTIAFEMAAQLRSRNFDVPLLMSVDGPAPRTIPGLELPSTFPKPPFFERVAGRLRRETAARKEAWRYRHGDPETRREIVYQRITKAYLRAVRRHTAQRYLGPVIHFKGTDSEGFPNHSDLAWKQAVPRVEIHTMDCSHSEILQRPHVATVANAIVSALNTRYFRGELRNSSAS
jgi:thioesterase domain-containing protein/acyl carrier protein